MEEIKETDNLVKKLNQHRFVVANFIETTLREHKYYLEKIIYICKLAKIHDELGISGDKSGAEICFLFNSYAGTYQTLKDSLETSIDNKIAWSRFDQIRHSSLMKDCRNAMTHDGMQIINAYSHGKFYIASNIERFDSRKKLIEIPAPKEDILTICIEFSYDLMNEIDTIISDSEINLPDFDHESNFERLKDALNSEVVPDYVKQLFLSDEENIKNSLMEERVDLASKIYRETHKIKNLCNRRTSLKP